jgi:hypothetical protein
MGLGHVVCPSDTRVLDDGLSPLSVRVLAYSASRTACSEVRPKPEGIVQGVCDQLMVADGASELLKKGAASNVRLPRRSFVQRFSTIAEDSKEDLWQRQNSQSHP